MTVPIAQVKEVEPHAHLTREVITPPQNNLSSGPEPQLLTPDLPKNIFSLLNEITLSDDTYRNMKTMEEHLEWCHTLPTPCGEVQLPDWMLEPIDNLARDPEAAISAAERKVEQLLRRKQELRKDWEAKLQTLDPDVAKQLGVEKNVLMIVEIMEMMQYEDRALADDLMAGFPVCGELTYSNLNERDPEATLKLDPEKLLDDAMSFQNERMKRQTANKKPDPVMNKALMKKTMQDNKLGWNREVDINSNERRLITSRFGKNEGPREKIDKEGRKYVEDKIRPCDNYKTSRLNQATLYPEECRYQSIDFLIALARRLIHHDPTGSRGKLKFLKSDFSSAYNTLPLKPEHRRFCHVIVRDEDSGLLREFESLVAQFGAVSSVHSWDRLGGFCQRVSCWLGIPMSRFVDDLLSCMYGSYAKRMHSLMRKIVVDLIGWNLDKKKDACADSIVGLGIQIDNPEPFIIDLLLPEDKKTKWSASIKDTLKSKRATSSQMSKHQGRMSWASTDVLGRGLRVWLRQLYNHSTKYNTKISKATEAALQFFLEILQTDIRTRIDLRDSTIYHPVKRVIAYSDAEDKGNMGATLVYKNRREYWHAKAAKIARKNSHHRKNETPLWECLAGISLIWQILCDSFYEDITELFLLTDNSALLGLLRNGCSGRSDLNSMAQDVLKQLSLRGITLVVLFVPTHLNLADGPSRLEELPHKVEIQQKMRELHSMGFLKTEFSCPVCPLLNKFW